MTHLDDAALDAIEQRADAAARAVTEGPWQWLEERKFVDHALADIPALLAAVREARAAATDAEHRAQAAEQRAEIAEAVILDAALAEQAEDIAQAIRDLPHGQTNSTPWVPDFDAGWRHGRMDCLAAVQAIARDGREARR